MRTIIAITRVFVYSNLFISVCILFLSHQTYLLLQLPSGNSKNVLAFIFCATFFTYNFQRLYRLNAVDFLGKNVGIRLGWIIRNKKKLFLASVLSGLLCMYFVFKFSRDVFILIIPLSIFSVFYVLPIIRYNQINIAIRDIPFVKIIVISVVWSMVMVAIPFIEVRGFTTTLDSSFLFLIAEQFLFILAITLPFDVRDLRYDKENKIKTIPAHIGVRNTILLSQFLLSCFLLLKGIQFYYFQQLIGSQFVATSIATILTMIIVGFTSEKRSELFFSGLIDGTMLIMYFAVLYIQY